MVNGFGVHAHNNSENLQLSKLARLLFKLGAAVVWRVH